MEVLLFSVIFLVVSFVHIDGTEACYFQQEFQGEFIMQSSISLGSGVQYGTLNITATSIPIWGNCHRRIGNNYILVNNFGETSCIRCLHLKLRSPNVLQVITSTKDIISQCFISEEIAERNCPTEESTLNSEILLFKTKDALGTPTENVYCPIDGQYHVTYKGKNIVRPNECTGKESTMDSCPTGSTLNFRLKGCTFDSYDLKFDCLAHWTTPTNEKILVFVDNRHLSGQKPKYRCSVYKEDSITGQITMAISNDSTCAADLNTPNGYETFVLTPQNSPNWPAEVSLGMCSFPNWLEGDWEHMAVTGDTLVYKDHTSFKTYTVKCVGIQEEQDKYLIYRREQCNQESYNCMKIRKRSNNIMEFQLGTNSSDTNDIDLCSENNFLTNSWVTQGRKNVLPGVSGMCPITGEYTGVIPDAPELCAKLWSDCRAPELMYYQVSQCASGEVYEEREYLCLGHWREAELLYTYTERRDMASYECFVGSIVSADEIYIKEAGDNCQRQVDPFGMKLKKRGMYSCISHEPSSTVPPTTRKVTRPTSRPTTTYISKFTRKPWNFDDATEKETTTKASSASAIYLHSCTVLYIFVRIFVLLL